MCARIVWAFIAVLALAAALTGQPGSGLAQERELTAAFNASGQDLFGRLSGGEGNIVLSSYAIGAAMAMVLLGARGDTEFELLKVLRHSLPRPAIEAANARVLTTLNGYESEQNTAHMPARIEPRRQHLQSAAVGGRRLSVPGTARGRPVRRASQVCAIGQGRGGECIDAEEGEQCGPGLRGAAQGQIRSRNFSGH